MIGCRYYQPFVVRLQIRGIEERRTIFNWSLCLFLVLVATPATRTLAAEPGDYLTDGRLKHPLQIHHLQLGGFAGRLETKISIGADNAWTGSFGVGGRANEKTGKLSGEQLSQLTAALAENDLAGLPKTIGSTKPVKSPKQIADGASTTIRVTYGEQTVTAHVADGVEMDAATKKLMARLRQIEAAMRQVTLNAKPTS